MWILSIEENLAKWMVDLKVANIPKTLREFVVKNYGDYLAILRAKKCPFCGRLFTTKTALYLHLRRSSQKLRPCYVKYDMLVRGIVKEWLNGGR